MPVPLEHSQDPDEEFLRRYFGCPFPETSILNMIDKRKLVGMLAVVDLPAGWQYWGFSQRKDWVIQSVLLPQVNDVYSQATPPAAPQPTPSTGLVDLTDLRFIANELRDIWLAMTRCLPTVCDMMPIPPSNRPA